MKRADVVWADYSGAAPILLPVDLLPDWSGFWLPAEDGESGDAEFDGRWYDVCDDFDFENPITDYDRACALGGFPAVQTLPVGNGEGLVLATELDRLTWWAERSMVVNGGALPTEEGLERVEWSDELEWTAPTDRFVLMNACDHGLSSKKDLHFDVRLPPGPYLVQSGSYGWADDDPALVLFRFVRLAESSKRTEA